ncbi:hypothetical protein BH11BAC3_BH11BAC3_22200 [soil metagenome]
MIFAGFAAIKKDSFSVVTALGGTIVSMGDVFSNTLKLIASIAAIGLQTF